MKGPQEVGQENGGRQRVYVYWPLASCLHNSPGQHACELAPGSICLRTSPGQIPRLSRAQGTPVLHLKKARACSAVVAAPAALYTSTHAWYRAQVVFKDCGAHLECSHVTVCMSTGPAAPQAHTRLCAGAHNPLSILQVGLLPKPALLPALCMCASPLNQHVHSCLLVACFLAGLCCKRQKSLHAQLWMQSPAAVHAWQQRQHPL